MTTFIARGSGYNITNADAWNYIDSVDTPLLDEGSWYNGGTGYVDVPQGQYLVIVSVQGEDNNFGTSAVLEVVITSTASGGSVVRSRHAERSATGTPSPKRNVAGILNVGAGGASIGAGVRHTDTAARDVIIELNITSI